MDVQNKCKNVFRFCLSFESQYIQQRICLRYISLGKVAFRLTISCSSFNVSSYLRLYLSSFYFILLDFHSQNEKSRCIVCQFNRLLRIFGLCTLPLFCASNIINYQANHIDHRNRNQIHNNKNDFFSFISIYRCLFFYGKTMEATHKYPEIENCYVFSFD